MNVIRSDRRARTLVLIAVLVLAASVRVWGLRFGLPNTACRPDESVIVEIASRFWSGGPERAARIRFSCTVRSAKIAMLSGT